MQKLAAALARQAPGMRVQFVDLVPDNYIDTINRYEVDLALIPRTDFPGWIAHDPVFHSSFVVIARSGHPRIARAGVEPGGVVPIDLFCDLSHVLFSPEGRFRAMGDAARARIGRERRVVMTMPVFGGVVRAVSESDLVALLPRQLARSVAGRFGLDIFAAPIHVPPPLLCMIWHKRATGNPAHRWLRGVIADILRPLNEGEAALPDHPPQRRATAEAVPGPR